MITSIKTSHKLGENQATYIYLTRASLVAHLVKMQETPVQCLGWEDTLEKGQATHSSILGLSWWPDSKESACNAETWVQSLGWKDPLKEGMETYSGVFPWRRGAWWATVCRAGHDFATQHTHIYLIKELYLECRRILTTQEKIYNSIF